MRKTFTLEVPQALRAAEAGNAKRGPFLTSRKIDLAASPKRVAIVGSRACSEHSLRFAEDLASVLAARGVIIVSGGALGIDTAAHRGALAGGGTSWAVLPTAYPETTPPENHAFFRQLHQDGGTIIWTLAEESRSPRPQFLARNGVLASLSTAVVVVAAGEKSGARNAAGWARIEAALDALLAAFPD